MSRLKSRNENFGKTLFDNKTGQYRFMRNNEYEHIKEQVNHITEFNNFVDNSNDIIYSPIKVFFDITKECNLRCKTCLNSSGKSLDDELTEEEATNVVQGLHNDAVFEIKITGGEPTMKRGWEKILGKANELGISFSVNTNGIYDKDIVDKLTETNPREISMSFDGFRDTNDIIRGKGSFEKAKKSLIDLYNNGNNITINSVITRLTTKLDIQKLLDLSNSYCSDISFFPARPLGRAVNMKDNLLDYNETSDMMDIIDEMKKKYSDFSVRTRDSSITKNSINNNSFGLMNGGSDGFTRFNIMSNGDLYAGGCELYVNEEFAEVIKLGNIKDEFFTIKNIWNDSKKLRGIRVRSEMLKEKCDVCEDYKSKCQGFTLEMDTYAKINNKNMYCKK